LSGKQFQSKDFTFLSRGGASGKKNKKDKSGKSDKNEIKKVKERNSKKVKSVKKEEFEEVIDDIIDDMSVDETKVEIIEPVSEPEEIKSVDMHETKVLLPDLLFSFFLSFLILDTKQS
jgi:hypothetical protein